MAKIAFIGAGSTVFARNLLRDLFMFPELHNSTIALMDIDEQRLKDSEVVAHRVADAAGAKPTIEATTDRRRALDGADYAINMIQVGGYKPSTVIDFEIPKKYGLRQTIADTLGVGGIMRALRTIPVMLDMARDMEAVCPDVTFLNYTNPMAMLCWAMNRATKINTVGLCHSVFGTASELARDIKVPVNDINYLCAGINHMAFYLKFERDGEDLYPRIRDVLADNKQPDWNRVRYEMFKRLGYFVTESSEHFSEYTPWFIKHDQPELIEEFNIPLDEYPRRCEAQIADWEGMRTALYSKDPQAVENYEKERYEQRIAKVAKRDPARAEEMRHEWEEQGESNGPVHSGEYGTLIIHAMETGKPAVVYGNVNNSSLIDNLPVGCCVEVPCLVDKSGLQPVKIGALPPQLAALMHTNINVQSLTVEAALTGKREHIYHAAMLDPHTSAELNLDQIWSLVDDLIEAHGDMLPTFR